MRRPAGARGARDRGYGRRRRGCRLGGLLGGGDADDDGGYRHRSAAAPVPLPFATGPPPDRSPPPPPPPPPDRSPPPPPAFRKSGCRQPRRRGLRGQRDGHAAAPSWRRRHRRQRQLLAGGTAITVDSTWCSPASSAFFISVADANRCPASGDSARAEHAPSGGGSWRSRSGRCSSGRPPSPDGSTPVSAYSRTMPAWYRSARARPRWTPAARAPCSSGFPPLRRRRQRPASADRTRGRGRRAPRGRSQSMRMLAGLTSRWTKRLACSTARPSRTWTSRRPRARLQRPVLGEELVQRAARHVLHHQVHAVGSIGASSSDTTWFERSDAITTASRGTGRRCGRRRAAAPWRPRARAACRGPGTRRPCRRGRAGGAARSGRQSPAGRGLRDPRRPDEPAREAGWERSWRAARPREDCQPEDHRAATPLRGRRRHRGARIARPQPGRRTRCAGTCGYDMSEASVVTLEQLVDHAGPVGRRPGRAPDWPVAARPRPVAGLGHQGDADRRVGVEEELRQLATAGLGQRSGDHRGGEVMVDASMRPSASSGVDASSGQHPARRSAATSGRRRATERLTAARAACAAPRARPAPRPRRGPRTPATRGRRPPPAARRARRSAAPGRAARSSRGRRPGAGRRRPRCLASSRLPAPSPAAVARRATTGRRFLAANDSSGRMDEGAAADVGPRILTPLRSPPLSCLHGFPRIRTAWLRWEPATTTEVRGRPARAAPAPRATPSTRGIRPGCAAGRRSGPPGRARAPGRRRPGARCGGSRRPSGR